MIKKFMLVCSLMVGGSPWALAQTPQVKLARTGICLCLSANSSKDRG